MRPNAFPAPSWLLAALYAALAVVLYAPILDAFFLADDFNFLELVRTADSPWVMFSGLAGRFFRPLVVFVYYANHQMSGLSPWSYHLSMLLIHLANTWLVFLLGRELAPERRPLLPALASLLFLVFGGHTEAISWVASVADPLVTLFLLSGLLCFLHALDSPRPARWIVGVWVAFGGAVLSKESSVIFPGLALLALFYRVGWPTRAHVRRAALALVPLVLIGVVYLVARQRALGFATVALEGLGLSQSPLQSLRRFFARSFLPQGPLLIWIWERHIDAIGWVIVGVGAVAGMVRREYRALTFLTLCLLLALAPVVPLSIGIATTDSERFIYLPSAFASLLVVWTLDAGLRRPWLVSLATVLFCCWHVVELRRHNRVWKATAAMTEAMTTSFATTVRTHWKPGQRIFLMTRPDNLRSKFIWRNGFEQALRMTAPDLAGAIEKTETMSIVNLSDTAARIDVTQRSARTFELRLTQATLVGEGGAAPSLFYTAREVTPAGFVVDFNAFAGDSLVIYPTPSQMAVAGPLGKLATSFGSIDLPAGAANCNETDPTLVGWALDDDGIARIAVAIERTDGSGNPVEIGEAQRSARPDVAQLFPALPDAPTAGWAFQLPCAAVKAKAVHSPAQVVVIAEDRLGERTRIGARPLVFPN